jgi:hypothetical protein
VHELGLIFSNTSDHSHPGSSNRWPDGIHIRGIYLCLAFSIHGLARLRRQLLKPTTHMEIIITCKYPLRQAPMLTHLSSQLS